MCSTAVEHNSCWPLPRVPHKKTSTKLSQGPVAVGLEALSVQRGLSGDSLVRGRQVAQVQRCGMQAALEPALCRRQWAHPAGRTNRPFTAASAVDRRRPSITGRQLPRRCLTFQDPSRESRRSPLQCRPLASVDAAPERSAQPPAALTLADLDACLVSCFPALWGCAKTGYHSCSQLRRYRYRHQTAGIRKRGLSR